MVSPTPSARNQDDYIYDVFVSYPRQGNVEPWVRNHLVPRLKMALQENLARQSVFIDSEGLDTGVSWPEALEDALRHSRLLLAVFSKQYFLKAWCRAELDSMLARHEMVGLGTAKDPTVLVHAIVAHDCDDESVPADYSNLQRRTFKKFVYDYPDQGWDLYKEFEDSVGMLAERISETIARVPPWQPDFPMLRPPEAPSGEFKVPRF